MYLNEWHGITTTENLKYPGKLQIKAVIWVLVTSH